MQADILQCLFLIRLHYLLFMYEYDKAFYTCCNRCVGVNEALPACVGPYSSPAAAFAAVSSLSAGPETRRQPFPLNLAPPAPYEPQTGGALFDCTALQDNKSYVSLFRTGAVRVAVLPPTKAAS